jgi:hypothetical protein
LLNCTTTGFQDYKTCLGTASQRHPTPEHAQCASQDSLAGIPNTLPPQNKNGVLELGRVGLSARTGTPTLRFQTLIVKRAFITLCNKTVNRRRGEGHWPSLPEFQCGDSRYILLEKRVLHDHPLRRVRAMADRALGELSGWFDSLYAQTGRPSIPPEQLLRGQILQALSTIRSQRW